MPSGLTDPLVYPRAQIAPRAGAGLTNVVQHWRTSTPYNPPAPNSLMDGQLSLEQADPMRIWMGVPVSLDPTGRRLLYDASAATSGGTRGQSGQYVWSIGTSPNPPTSWINGNTTDQTAITTLYINNITTDGVDASAVLGLIKTGDVLYIQARAVAANYRTYNVTAPSVNNGTYFSVPVSYRQGGGVALGDAQSIILSLLSAAVGQWLPLAGGNLTGTLGTQDILVAGGNPLPPGGAYTRSIYTPALNLPTGANVFWNAYVNPQGTAAFSLMGGPAVAVGQGGNNLYFSTYSAANSPGAALTLSARIILGGGVLQIDSSTALMLAGNASAALQAVPLQQVNSIAGNYLPLGGGIIAGNLSVTGTLSSTGVTTLGANSVFDARGNLGVGITPPAGQAGRLSGIGGWLFGWGITTQNFASNGYYDGTSWRYSAAGYLSLMSMSAGADGFSFQTAPSGSAGAAATMTQAAALTSAGAFTATATIRSNNGRIIAYASGNPGFCCYNSAGYAAGMFASGTTNLYFGGMDGNGNYVGPPYGWFDTNGNFWSAAATTATYLHTTGALQVDANIQSNGGINCNTRIRTAEAFMSASGTFYVADNTNYYLSRGGDGAWRFVENGTVNSTLDTGGNFTARGGVYGQWVQSYGDALFHNTYIDGGLGLNFRGVYNSGVWYAFGWDGHLNIAINGGGQGQLAYVGDVNARYSPNQNVDVNAGVTFANITNNGYLQSNDLRSSSGNGVYYNAYSHWFAFWYANGPVFLRMDGGNDLQLGSLSDERVKQDIAPSRFDCLKTILAVPLYEYRYKELPAQNDWSAEMLREVRAARQDAPLHQIGFVAQRLHEVFPDAAYGWEEDVKTWGVNVQTVVAALVGAMQQLAAEVADLKARH
jgi:hypothetical protein